MGEINIGILVLIAQVIIIVLFQRLESFLKQKVQQASPRPQAHTKSNTETSAQPSTESIKNRDDLDPTYVEFISCRDAVKELKESPDSFVEYAKRSRELIKLEKRWKLVYNGLSIEEKQKYDSVMKPAGQSPNGQNGSSLTSRFAQVMDPSLSAEQKADLYKQMLGEFFSGQRNSSSSAASDAKPYSQILNSLSILRILMTWIIIHIIVGYSPVISSVPLVAVESSFFRPWGFIMKRFFNQLPQESVKKYIIGEPNMSEMQFLSMPNECRQYWSFGLMGSIFILNQAMTHAKKSFWDSDGTLLTGIRYLTSGKKLHV